MSLRDYFSRLARLVQKNLAPLSRTRFKIIALAGITGFVATPFLVGAANSQTSESATTSSTVDITSSTDSISRPEPAKQKTEITVDNNTTTEQNNAAQKAPNNTAPSEPQTTVQLNGSNISVPKTELSIKQ